MVLKAKDIMTRNVLTISLNAKVEEAASIMASRPVSCLVVIHHMQPIGIITERDIVREVVAPGFDGSVRVNEVMKTRYYTLKPNETIFGAIRHIQKDKIRHFPVVDEGKLLGIVTESDIVRGLQTIEEHLEELLKKGELSIPEYTKKHKELLEELSVAKKSFPTVSSGSKDMDKLVGGGFPLGSNIMVEGAPGSGKGLVAFSFLADGLRKDEVAVYVFANDTLENIANGFRAVGVDMYPYVKNGLLQFIEVSNKSKTPSEYMHYCSFTDANAMTSILDEIDTSNRNAQVRCVINTLSQAMMFLDTKTVYQNAFDFTEHLKKSKITTLYVIEEGMHELSSQLAMENLMDGVIEITFKESNMELERRLIVKKMEGGKFIPQKYFLCGFEPEKGIVIKEAVVKS